MRVNVPMKSPRSVGRRLFRSAIASAVVAAALLLVAIDVVPWGAIFIEIIPKDDFTDEASTNTDTGLSTEELLQQPFASRIIVSEKAKLIYCPVPKAASSNWKYLIRKFEGQEDYSNLTRGHSRALSGLKFLSDYPPKRAVQLLADPEMFKFVFVRDPSVRAMSCYKNKFSGMRSPAEYRVFMAHLYNWTYANRMDMAKDPRPTFREFINRLAQQEPEEMDDHWRPQTHLCGFGTVKYDFIGRMETVAKDSAYVLSRLGRQEEEFPTQKQIGFLPSGTKKNHPIAPDLRKMLRYIYREDFAHGLAAPKSQGSKSS